MMIKYKGQIRKVCHRWVLLLLLLLVTVNVGNVSVNAVSGEEDSSKKDFIKWVDFQVNAEALKDAYEYDVETYGMDTHVSWIDLLAIQGAKNGGDFKQYRKSDLDAVVESLHKNEWDLRTFTEQLKYYSYYKEAYDAVLGGMVGEYQIQTDTSQGKYNTYYGLKAFHPIAKTFPFSHYDDFGVSRSYGYRRKHLGHDMMGQVGTPIICVESGKVTALGWNQYGGWRIGIESFDGRRYYYYAHLRQNRPYAENLKLGDIVTAGDVIGYMGRTGYSTKENVNNIDDYHLHFGIQLIFDESQKEGNGEIWISCYELVKFLSNHTSEVERNGQTKEWYRKYQMVDPVIPKEKGDVKKDVTQ